MRYPLNERKINKYEAFSKETKNFFECLFKNIFDSEKSCETWRIKLNLMKSFSIREIFSKIDRLQKNYLIDEDVII